MKQTTQYCCRYQILSDSFPSAIPSHHLQPNYNKAKVQYMNRVLCSTGAIIGRPNGRDFTLLSKYQERIDCDGYEFLMYDSWYEKIDDIRRFMQTFSTPVPVFHVEKSVGDLISRNGEGDTEKAVELFNVNCLLAKDLGSSKLVLHLWSGLDSDKKYAAQHRML